ncbi:universal stress protein [Vagococcus lutrae]|uniref:universal stress protein n=1 Tax=Vagococcus lutrae TaxID=81947 RepID=UPI0038B31C1C
MNQSYPTIMVAVDGSSAAEKALKKAIHVTRVNSAHLIIAHIIDTRAFQSLTSYDQEMADQALRVATETLTIYQGLAEEKDLAHISTVIEFGSPKHLLAEVLPKKYDVSLLMMGATGMNTMERLLLGSVSQYVSRHALCDVLIVR